MLILGLAFSASFFAGSRPVQFEVPGRDHPEADWLASLVDRPLVAPLLAAKGTRRPAAEARQLDFQVFDTQATCPPPPGLFPLPEASDSLAQRRPFPPLR